MNKNLKLRVELALIINALGYAYEEEKVRANNIKSVKKLAKPDSSARAFWYKYSNIEQCDNSDELLLKRKKEIEKKLRITPPRIL